MRRGGEICFAHAQLGLPGSLPGASPSPSGFKSAGPRRKLHIYLHSDDKCVFGKRRLAKLSLTGVAFASSLLLGRVSRAFYSVALRIGEGGARSLSADFHFGIAEP